MWCYETGCTALRSTMSEMALLTCEGHNRRGRRTISPRSPAKLLALDSMLLARLRSVASVMGGGMSLPVDGARSCATPCAGGAIGDAVLDACPPPPPPLGPLGWLTVLPASAGVLLVPAASSVGPAASAPVGEPGSGMLPMGLGWRCGPTSPFWPPWASYRGR